MTLKKILFGFGIIAIVFTLIPLIPSDYWLFRMFDFLYIQLTTITLVAIITFFIKFDIKYKKDYLFVSLLLICFAYQFSKIVPFTPLHDKEVLDSTFNDHQYQIKLLTANVLQENENSERLVETIKKLDADVMVFTEANKRWKEAILNNLSADYKYKVELPLDNTYGMLMYSKLELINPEIKFMVTDSIPSIHTKVRLRSGDVIKIYAVHPTPPMPQENKQSTDRDAELMLTARLARESETPAVVIGDFNDIAWSSTSKLFQRSSELLDVRVGRGFYCTYNAKKSIMRWALDHIYVSPEFRLLNLKSCSSIESDHFPYYVELNYEPEGAKEQMPEPATAKELERAQKQIEKLSKKSQ